VKAKGAFCCCAEPTYRSKEKGDPEGRWLQTLRSRRKKPSQDATRTDEMEVMVAVCCFLSGRSQPAESQASGMENTDQPQSMQTLISGEGVIGGWLRVRGELR